MNRIIGHAVGISSGLLVGFSSTEIAQKFFTRNVLAEECVEPPNYPWSHRGWLASYDHAR